MRKYAKFEITSLIKSAEISSLLITNSSLLITKASFYYYVGFEFAGHDIPSLNYVISVVVVNGFVQNALNYWY